MGYSFQDFVLVDSKSADSDCTLSSDAVQTNTLIIAVAANADEDADWPYIHFKGAKVAWFCDMVSAPMHTLAITETHTELVPRLVRRQGVRVRRVRRWYGPPCHNWGYWYWDYERTPYYYYETVYDEVTRTYTVEYPPVHVRVAMAVAQAAGRIDAVFEGSVFDAELRLYDMNLSADTNQEIVRASFTAAPVYPHIVSEYVAFMPFRENDIVVVMGLDDSQDAALAEITLSGPTRQSLFNQLFQRNNRSVKVKIERCKSSGNLYAYYDHVSAGKVMARWRPNVQLRTITHPTPPEDEDVVVFEIWGEQDSTARVTRPPWFEKLYKSVETDPNFGIWKSWTKEPVDTLFTPEGEMVVSRWKVAEIWQAPKDYLSFIGDEALVFDNLGDAEARVIAHDEEWI